MNMVMRAQRIDGLIEKTREGLRTVGNLIKAGEMRHKGNIIEMDAGVIFKTIYGDRATITIAEYPRQGSRSPNHCHEKSKEYLICIVGSFSVAFDKSYRIIKAGECVSLDKILDHTVTSLEANSKLVAICVPEEDEYKRSMQCQEKK